MMAHSLQDHLTEGFKALQLSLNPTPFLEYLSLMETWNKAFNLTAIKTMTERVNLHLLDSLAIIPWLQGSLILDVGTGPGLPGIPLALACPDIHFVLLDSNGKKTRFLTEVKRALDLQNVEIVQARAEHYHPHCLFDTIVSRAFSDLKQMLSWTKHLIAPQGIWLAMKGRYPEDELKNLPSYLSQVHAYSVPFVNGERCCVVVKSGLQL